MTDNRGPLADQGGRAGGIIWPVQRNAAGDLGADVVRVTARALGTVHDLLNWGKRSIVVDLKHAQGAVVELARRADVLIEGLRPGVTERLGVGPEQCWEVNPQLVYGRMTGWGQDGPLASTAGHDIAYIALTGMLHAIGRQGGPPQVPINLLGDFGGGGMYLTVGILAALLEARGSGRGQVVDAAIVDGTAHLGMMIYGMLAAGGWSTERGTNLLDTGAPFYDVYETADGKHMAVGALEPQFYAELLDRLGLTGEAPDRDDPENWPRLRELLAETFRQRTQQEWTEVFSGSDACVAPVLSMTEAEDHRTSPPGEPHPQQRRPAAGPGTPLQPNHHQPRRSGQPRSAHHRGVPGLAAAHRTAGDRRRAEGGSVSRMRRELFEPEHEAFRETAREFITRELQPHQQEWEAAGVVSREAWRAAGKLGLLGFAVDEQYGGGGTPDFRFNVVLDEELVKAGISGFGAPLHNDVIAPTCCAGQRGAEAALLPGFCSGELITAIAMTEPGAGSDLQGIRTTAVRDGDHYVLNGQKTFISNGILADLRT